MIRNHRLLTIAWHIAVVVCVFANPTAAQTQAPAGGDRLVSLIPQEAFFYVERRGHEAVREAFLASNLGKMAEDEAIKQFVHDSRVRIGQMIVKGMFDLETMEEIKHHQELLHELLKPFWYKPCAIYVVVDKNFSNEPGLGFICITGKYRAECKKALDALMQVGVPAEGAAGTRQVFTYRKHATVWQGVAKGDSAFALPEDPKKQIEMLEKRSVFMVCWLNDILLVATKLSAADAMSRRLSVATPSEGKSADESFQVVMKKTKLKDWAFRWYLDLKPIMASAKSDGSMSRVLSAMGIDQIRGVGGTGGYADKVYTRLTYIHAPKISRGPLRLLKQGGSYKKGLAMVPDPSTILLAGEFDKKVLPTMIREMMASESGSRSPATLPAETASQPTAELDERASDVLKQIELLADASNGHAGLFLTDIVAMMGMMAGGGPPVGAVLGLEDRASAVKAIDELVRLAGVEAQEEEDEEELEGPPKAKQYRKVPIRYLGEMVRMAILADRVVIAMSDDAMKSAIDAALDGIGGFAPEGKSLALANLAGDGAGIFKLDLAAFAKTFWPLLMQMAESMPEQFPLVSMPSGGKMVRLLGPEIAVLSGEADGVLMKSRGKIPFSTKMILSGPLGMASFFFMFRAF